MHQPLTNAIIGMREEKVASLIDQGSHYWDVQKVLSCYIPSIAQAILKINLLQVDQPDMLTWDHEKMDSIRLRVLNR